MDITWWDYNNQKMKSYNTQYWENNNWITFSITLLPIQAMIMLPLLIFWLAAIGCIAKEKPILKMLTEVQFISMNFTKTTLGQIMPGYPGISILITII